MAYKTYNIDGNIAYCGFILWMISRVDVYLRDCSVFTRRMSLV